MKKYILLFLIILLISSKIKAQTYNVKDLSISIDDDSWFVFTLDNLEKNPYFDQYNLSYDFLNNIMKRDNIYLYAVAKSDEDINSTLILSIIISEVDNIMNLHTFSGDELNKLGNSFRKGINTFSYNVFNTNGYVYFHANLFEASPDYYVEHYYTIINKFSYGITARKKTPFTKEEIENIENIVKTSNFKLDSLYENYAINRGVNKVKRTLLRTFITIIGGLTLGVFFKVGKKERK